MAGARDAVMASMLLALVGCGSDSQHPAGPPQPVDTTPQEAHAPDATEPVASGNTRAAADVAALLRDAEAAFGPVVVWINNAGLARHRPIPDYTEAEIDLMLAVNLKGTILGSQAALRAMAPRRRGHIVNIVSTASLRGVPTETVYCAAKWGARGFTQGLREEAAPFGVRVTALLPGGVDTAFWDDAARDRDLPRDKWLCAEDIASATLALLALPDHAVPQELVLRAMHDRDFSS
mgnify:CR=1 FL=1